MITGKTGSFFWSARDWSTGSKIIASCKRSKFKNKLVRLKTCKQRCLNARRLKQVRVHSSAAGSEAPGAAALLWGKQLLRGRERGTWARMAPGVLREGKERQEERGQLLLWVSAEEQMLNPCSGCSFQGGTGPRCKIHLKTIPPLNFNFDSNGICNKPLKFVST